MVELDKIIDLLEQCEDYPTDGTPRQCVKYGIEIAIEAYWKGVERYLKTSGMDKSGESYSPRGLGERWTH